MELLKNIPSSAKQPLSRKVVSILFILTTLCFGGATFAQKEPKFSPAQSRVEFSFLANTTTKGFFAIPQSDPYFQKPAENQLYTVQVTPLSSYPGMRILLFGWRGTNQSEATKEAILLICSGSEWKLQIQEKTFPLPEAEKWEFTFRYQPEQHLWTFSQKDSPDKWDITVDPKALLIFGAECSQAPTQAVKVTLQYPPNFPISKHQPVPTPQQVQKKQNGNPPPPPEGASRAGTTPVPRDPLLWGLLGLSLFTLIMVLWIEFLKHRRSANSMSNPLEQDNIREIVRSEIAKSSTNKTQHIEPEYITKKEFNAFAREVLRILDRMEATLPEETDVDASPPAPVEPPPPALSPEQQRVAEAIAKWEQIYPILKDNKIQAVQKCLLQWEKVYDILYVRWESVYAKAEPSEWMGQNFFNLDEALYMPLEIPTSISATLQGSFIELKKLFIEGQEIRKAQLKARGIERVDGIVGVTTFERGVIERDTSVSNPPSPPATAYSGKLHSIRPGKGGYRYKGKVIRKTEAIFYAQIQPDQSSLLTQDNPDTTRRSQ